MGTGDIHMRLDRETRWDKAKKKAKELAGKTKKKASEIYTKHSPGAKKAGLTAAKVGGEIGSAMWAMFKKTKSGKKINKRIKKIKRKSKKGKKGKRKKNCTCK